MVTRGADRDRQTVTQFVNCLGIGGTERQLVEQLRRLDTRAWRTDVLCLQKIGEFLEPVRALGYEPEEFPLRGTLMQPNTALQAARIARRLRRDGSLLLHSHDFYTNLVGSVAARMAGVPNIVSRRDLGAWVGPVRAAALRLATRRATKVLCNAYAIRDSLVSNEGIAPERIAVIHNGLDLDRFDAEATRGLTSPVPGLDDRHPAVAFVGNMKHAVKGHADLLTAAAAVVRAVPEARFLLVGDGELRADLERTAREMGIDHALVFTGRRTDVAALLSRARVAVCPSHSEGLSNALMESMAARLPVVATAVGGNIELVRDGRTGCLVGRGDAPALAQRLVELLRRPDLARRMGLAGRRRIEQEFSADRMSHDMMALYAELTGRGAEQRRAA